MDLGQLFAMLSSSDLPPRDAAQVRATSATPAALRSVIEEYLRVEPSSIEAASLRDFGDKLLMVLSAGVGSAADWPQMQERLPRLSTDSVHRVVAGASHAGLAADETHAANTSQAILEVVMALRTGHPLSR